MVIYKRLINKKIVDQVMRAYKGEAVNDVNNINDVINTSSPSDSPNSFQENSSCSCIIL